MDDEIPAGLSAEWIQDCLEWRGRVLVGRQAHWCGDWDDLPVDETCPEWPCDCTRDAEGRVI